MDGRGYGRFESELRIFRSDLLGAFRRCACHLSTKAIFGMCIQMNFRIRNYHTNSLFAAFQNFHATSWQLYAPQRSFDILNRWSSFSSMSIRLVERTFIQSCSTSRNIIDVFIPSLSSQISRNPRAILGAPTYISIHTLYFPAINPSIYFPDFPGLQFNLRRQVAHNLNSPRISSSSRRSCPGPVTQQHTPPILVHPAQNPIHLHTPMKPCNTPINIHTRTHITYLRPLTLPVPHTHMKSIAAITVAGATQHTQHTYVAQHSVAQGAGCVLYMTCRYESMQVCMHVWIGK